MLVNTNNNLSPSFEAFPTGKGKINILKKSKYYFPKYRLVELNVNNILDIMALDKADKKWYAENKELGNDTCHYLKDIWNDAVKKREKDTTGNNCENIQIFALTKQRFYFHWLNPEKILAVAQIRIKDREIPKIDYIQVRPKYQHANKQREIKGIGQYLLNYLKALCDGKWIIVYPDDHSAGFYKKYGGYPDESFGSMKYYI